MLPIDRRMLLTSPLVNNNESASAAGAWAHRLGREKVEVSPEPSVFAGCLGIAPRTPHGRKDQARYQARSSRNKRSGAEHNGEEDAQYTERRLIKQQKYKGGSSGAGTALTPPSPEGHPATLASRRPR